MSRANLCKEGSRVGGWSEGTLTSCKLCNGAEPLLATLPTSPVVCLRPTFKFLTFWGEPWILFPSCWPLKSESLDDIARLSVDITGAVTRTYSRSIVSMESPDAPSNQETQGGRMYSVELEKREEPKHVQNTIGKMGTMRYNYNWLRNFKNGRCTDHTSTHRIIHYFEWKESRFPWKKWRKKKKNYSEIVWRQSTVLEVIMNIYHRLKNRNAQNQKYTL